MIKVNLYGRTSCGSRLIANLRSLPMPLSFFQFCPEFSFPWSRIRDRIRKSEKCGWKVSLRLCHITMMGMMRTVIAGRKSAPGPCTASPSFRSAQPPPYSSRPQFGSTRSAVCSYPHPQLQEPCPRTPDSALQKTEPGLTIRNGGQTEICFFLCPQASLSTT